MSVESQTHHLPNTRLLLRTRRARGLPLPFQGVVSPGVGGRDGPVPERGAQNAGIGAGTGSRCPVLPFEGGLGRLDPSSGRERAVGELCFPVGSSLEGERPNYLE